MRFPRCPKDIIPGLLALAFLGGMVLFPASARSAPDREVTALSSPGDRGGTNVEDVRQLRFQDANGDSHVFEIEELPSWAAGDRGGALQISPVARSTYATDTDYLLVHPRTGAIDLGGPGALHLHGSPLRGVKGMLLEDADEDGRSFLLEEMARGGSFKGMLRLRAQPGRTIFVADPETGSLGLANDLAVQGHLGTMGIPVRLGEPLQVEGQPIRGLSAEPCDTCAVRADYFDGDGDGVVDESRSVRSLSSTVGCESGQLCSISHEVEVEAGGSSTVEFERPFASGLPRVVRNETFAPAEGSADRVPALTIQRILRDGEDRVTGVVVRNGDADQAHSGTVGIQGVVR